MLTFNPALRSFAGTSFPGWSLPLGNLGQNNPGDQTANPLQLASLGAADSYGMNQQSLGALGLGGTSFQMPSSQEMAQLLAEALSQGVGRKDQKNAGAQNGGTGGADLGNLLQGLAGMMSQVAMNGAGQNLGNLSGENAGAGPGSGQDPAARRARSPRRVNNRSLAHRTHDRPRTRAPANEGPRTRNETGIPNGLRQNAANGARVVREMGFRGTIGGLGHRAGRSDHPHGNAIDVMTNRDTAMGRRVAERFRQDHQRLGVKYVIYQQQIASPRTNWQWQRMADRGSPTANHMDHPHISFY
jgi:hypothetical protein